MSRPPRKSWRAGKEGPLLLVAARSRAVDPDNKVAEEAAIDVELEHQGFGN